MGRRQGEGVRGVAAGEGGLRQGDELTRRSCWVASPGHRAFRGGSPMIAKSVLCSCAIASDGSPPVYAGVPFHDSAYNGGPQRIPGRVQCAYFDLGGEGVAYHTKDTRNQGSGMLNPANGSYLNEFRMNEAVGTSYTKFHDAIDRNP